MKYVDTQVTESDLTHKIDERIKDERTTQRLRSEYMTYQMRLDERYAEGVSVGEQRGIPIGFDRGITVGSHERAAQTARNLLSMGFPLQQTAQATGLSLEEVQSLL